MSKTTSKSARKPAGPLTVSAANPRYFTIESGKASGQEAIYRFALHLSPAPDNVEGHPFHAANYDAFAAARYAMGDTLRYAQKMHLIEMEPRGDLSPTGYALANPGQEYLVLQPNETAVSFTVLLEVGTYRVEWYSINGRETADAGEITIESRTATSFSHPFAAAGPALFYLKKVGA